MFTVNDHTFAICAYGESPFLEECVCSLEQQTLRTNLLMATSTPNELIRGVAERHNIKLFVNDANPGIASDWNFALSCAETPLVTLAHQDDVYAAPYAEHALSRLDSCSDPLIYFCDYGELRNGRFESEASILQVKRKLLGRLEHCGGASKKTSIKRSTISLGNAICCPAVTYNLPLLPSPPFIPGLKSNLDWEAWERFSRLPGSFVYEPEVLMYHRIHGGSETSHLIHDNTRTAEDLAMLKKFWPAPVASLINLAYNRGQASNG